jgi:hypothetical protein
MNQLEFANLADVLRIQPVGFGWCLCLDCPHDPKAKHAVAALQRTGLRQGSRHVGHFQRLLRSGPLPLQVLINAIKSSEWRGAAVNRDRCRARAPGNRPKCRVQNSIQRVISRPTASKIRGFREKFWGEKPVKPTASTVSGRITPLQNVPETWFTPPCWTSPARRCPCHGRNGRSWKNACGSYCG